MKIRVDKNKFFLDKNKIRVDKNLKIVYLF